MKFVVSFLCFYFLIIILLPSVKAVKTQFADNSKTSYELANSQNDIYDQSCDKEKCFLSLKFNTSSFILFTHNYKISTSENLLQLLKLHYHKNLLSTYNSSIWEPPEYIFYLPNFKTA